MRPRLSVRIREFGIVDPAPATLSTEVQAVVQRMQEAPVLLLAARKEIRSAHRTPKGSSKDEEWKCSSSVFLG